MTRRTRNALILTVLAISLSIRLGAVIRIGNPQDVPRSLAESDAPTYFKLADNLLDGTGYRYSAAEPPTARRTPGYPLFIASVFKICGRNFNAVRVAQCMLDMISTFLVFALCLLIFGSPLAGILAALAYAVYPPVIIIVTHIMSETLFTFLLLLFAVTCILGIRSRQRALFAVSGIFLGLATLTRPGALPLPFVLLLAAAIWKRDLIRGFLILVVAFSFTMLPWGLRNERDMGKFIPTSTLVGGNLYKGNHLPTQGAYFMSTDSLLTDDIRARIAGTTEVQRDSILQAEAIRMIKSHKTATLALAAKKIPRLWLNLGYGRKPSRKSYAIAGLHGIFLVLGFVGLIRAPAARRYLNIVPVTTIVLSTVLYLAVAAEVRFVFPLIPLLLPYTAYGLVSVLKRGEYGAA
ncbi:MAG: glycosyltransferase family 39 protein [bacterium]|jgi:4-amino-4-deoxy-L-arabinose transferase-like glycosyltransferase